MTFIEFITLLGGVGLFLFGMTMMSSGLQNAAGDKLRGLLEKVTSNKIVAVLLGVSVTVLIQSSSATDMMVIGFVNSGLMELTEAILVIMGANIGTTVTAQITAFNLTAYAPLLVFVGVVLYLFVKKPVVKHVGSIIMGFGMLFVGIGLVKETIAPLAESATFVAFLEQLSNPVLAVLFGVAFTAVLQSSSSSTVIFQAFAVQGILDYQTAVYLVIGAAIGSVTPNILASLTTNRNGKRTALLNLIFNIFRAVILMILITVFPQILDFIQALSPDNVGRQIANTHTIFAIFAVLVMLPFSGKIVALTEKLLPVLPEEKRSKEEMQLLYMVDAKNTVPSVVIAQANKEVHRMGVMARNNLSDAMDCFFAKEDDLVEKVETTEGIVDYLTHEITTRLIQLQSTEISEADAYRATKLALIVSNFERISDHAQNIIEYRQQIGRAKDNMSKPARKEIKLLTEETLKTIDMAIDIFYNEDFSRIPEAEKQEEGVDMIHAEMMDEHVKRLMKGKCDPAAGIVFNDISTDLERCSDHAINIATALIPVNDAKLGKYRYM